MKMLVVAAAFCGLMLAVDMQAWSCDVAVVSARASTTGRPFIWKNYDSSQLWHQEIQYWPARYSGPGGYLLLYHDDNWMQTINGSPTVPQAGVNEAGFAMALTSVYENLNPAHEAGNLNTDLMQDALEQCVTLADFERLVRTWPYSHFNHAISGNFVAIDASGNAALYEMFTGYQSIGFMTIMYRRFDANTGRVTDQNGAQIIPAQTNFIGYVNRTNSHYWLPTNPGGEREARGRALLNTLVSTGTLNPQSMMRRVARDVVGKQIYSYSSDYNYNTTYCISRSATRSGVVVDGVASGSDPRRTTFWCALGEPSISVFVPYFAGAKGVSYLAYVDTIYNGVQYDTNDTCLLNLAEDSRETYNKLLYSSNRGDTLNGPYDNYINKIELAKVQQWTFSIENQLLDQTADFLEMLQVDGPDMTADEYSQALKGFSDYCASYTYGNYTRGSASAVPWTYIVP